MLKATARILSLASALIAWGATAQADVETVTIGVLAYRGDERALQRWGPTAAYLSQALPEYQFVIRPLDLNGMHKATAEAELDFILTNPGQYVTLEALYQCTRLVTLKNLHAGKPYTMYGAVIFTRADRSDITELEHLKKKSFMAVSKQAFGGFQMAWWELQRHGIDPTGSFSRLQFAGFPQDHIVYSVRDGEVDAGTVRTDTLERMAAEGRIDPATFRILNPQHTPGFPFAHSTRLYPEWPFATAQQTSDEIAQRVAVALLTMPSDHAAAQAGSYAGWTVPLDYQPVHELFKALRLGPYRQLGKITLSDVLQQHAHWLIAAVLVLLFMAYVTMHVLELYRQIKHSTLSLESEIQERKRAETQMHKLSRALEQTADTVMITDRQGVIEYVNPAFERVTGYRRDEARGHTPTIIRSGRHERAFYDSLWSTILRGEVFRAVFVNRRKDGALFYEEKTITPLKDNGARTTHFIATGKDITQRKIVEDRARRHQAELAHVSRVTTMGEMASGIAHELNQPLSAITNYAHGCMRRLKAGRSDIGQLATALAQITSQSERAAEIIRRLRNFVRKGELRRTRADINAIVREAAGFVAHEARRNSVHVQLKLTEDLPPVFADVIQIEQVIVNILRNAIEAMEPPDWSPRNLVVHTWQDVNARISVAVWDTGPGLVEQDYSHIFDAFYSTKAGGMGMGLSISRSIIEAHGDRLSAHANRDGGMTFRFNLPVAGEPRERA